MNVNDEARIERHKVPADIDFSMCIRFADLLTKGFLSYCVKM
jgi:hypothetical protein